MKRPSPALLEKLVSVARTMVTDAHQDRMHAEAYAARNMRADDLRRAQKKADLAGELRELVVELEGIPQ